MPGDEIDRDNPTPPPAGDELLAPNDEPQEPDEELLPDDELQAPDDELLPNDETEAPDDEPEAAAKPAEPESAAPDDPHEPEPDAPAQSDESAQSDDSKQPAKQLPPEALALCKSAIEAMLFSASGPVSSRTLSGALKDTGIDARGVRKLIRDLAAEYETARRGFTIEEVAGGFQMLTRPEYAEYIGTLSGVKSSTKLSQAALETLAVVAYKQPVTRADVESIRGVQAGPLLRALLQKGLVKITGRAEVLGRPLLYGTTRGFLEHFGLKSLNELPKVEELPKP